MLLEALSGSAYTVFPNVRFNDLMLIKASGSERQAVLGRLRDKHVDPSGRLAAPSTRRAA